MDQDKIKTVVPNVKVGIYRIVKPFAGTTRYRFREEYSRITPTSFISNFPVNSLKKVAGEDVPYDRVKEIMIDETALFGKVARVDIVEDPVTPIFEDIVPNDHVEMFLENATADNTNIANAVSNAFSSKEKKIKRLYPNFAGSVWKSSTSFRTGGYATRVNAWDYHRVMQFFNIPRGVARAATYTLLDINDDMLSDPSLETEKKVRLKRARGELRYKNFFLDYLNHCVEEFTQSITVFSLHNFASVKNDINDQTKDIVTFTKDITSSIDQSITLKLYTLEDEGSNTLQDGFVGATETNSSAVFSSDYSPSFSVEKLTNTREIKDVIKESEGFRINIFRIIDAIVQFPIDALDGNAEGSKYRVVMDIVSVDQFSAAKLLVSNMAYDYGINKWFVPVLNFDEDFYTTMTKLCSELSTDANSQEASIRIELPRIGQIVYARLYISSAIEVSNNNITNEYLNDLTMKPFAVFNLDTFPLLEYFNKADNIALDVFSREPYLLSGRPSVFDILSLLFTVVTLPQAKERTYVHTVPASLSPFFGNTLDANGILSLLAQLSLPSITINEDVNPLQNIALLKRGIQANISNTINTLHAILSLDSKLVSFITDIPDSYVRGEEYTGSKFKTFSYSSLPIIRMAQILSSSMHGFPATNNPQHATETGKVSSYPVFIANRVVVSTRTLFSAVGDSNSGIVEENDRYHFKCFRSATDMLSNRDSVDKMIMFVVIDVGFKKQVSASNAEFEIDVGNALEFDISKASSRNHFYVFSFGEHSEFLNLINNNENIKRWIEANEFYKLKMLFAEGSHRISGVTPGEATNLTLVDMTQNDYYDPWANRYNANDFFSIGSPDNIDHSSPIHTPLLASIIAFSDPADANKVVFSDYENRENVIKEIALEGGVFSQSSLQELHDEYGDKLVGCTGFIDISDLINEIRVLKVIADSYIKMESNLQDIGQTTITTSDGLLFKNIFIHSKFKFSLVEEGGLKKIAIEQKRRLGWGTRLHAILDDIYKVLSKITVEDMKWMFPLTGWALVNSTNVTRREELFVKVNAYTHPNLFSFAFENFFFIAYIDLLVKGLRYMLWNISKARMLAHIFLPPLEVQAKSVESAELYLEPGSSVIFKLPQDNLLRNNIAYAGSKKPLVKGFGAIENVPLFNTVSLSDRHLEGRRRDKPEVRDMVWYVSRRTTYLTPEEGLMQRLRLTEGSFDWTISFVEFYLATEYTENYLWRGLGNYTVGAE